MKLRNLWKLAVLLPVILALAGCGRCQVNNFCTVSQGFIDTQVNNQFYIPPSQRQVLCTTFAVTQSNYGSNCQITWQ